MLNQKKGSEASTVPTRRFTATILATSWCPDLLEPRSPHGRLITRHLQHPGGHFTTSSGEAGAPQDPPPPPPPPPSTAEPTGRLAGGRCRGPPTPPTRPTPGQTWCPPTPPCCTTRGASITTTLPSTATSACVRTIWRGQLGPRSGRKDARNVVLTGRDLTRRT